jgi:formyl-CoA transferase
MPLPLEGLRVIDLSRNIAGPLCTMLLGDLGAEAIKVERPGSGDESRGHADGAGISPYFAALNRNKRSICLDLKAQDDQRVLEALLATSDAMVDNLRPGALDRLGFDDERLAGDFPHLVVCHISGFGRVGPWAEATAYDHIIQGFAGLMSLTGPAGEGGYRTNTSVADVVTGLYAATSVTASLHGRVATGPRSGGGGDIIDLSLVGGLLNALCYQAATYLTTGVAPQPTGNQHPYIVPYGTYDTADGAINVCVGNNRLFDGLCSVLGIPEVSTDPRFSSNRSRLHHRDELNAELEPAFRCRSAAEWTAALRAVGVPVGPVHTLPEALEHEQVQALGLVRRTDDGYGGEVGHLGPPFRSPRLNGARGLRPPRVGEHTREIIDDLVAGGHLERRG